MEKARIAYLTTNETDVVPLISAIKAIVEEKGEIIKVCLRTGGDFMQPEREEHP